MKKPATHPATPGASNARPGVIAVMVGLVVGLGACASRNVDRSATVPVVQNVDLERYMGPWFVIGAIGLGVEKGAHNAMETYTLQPDGTIATVFRFRADAFDGPLETKVTKAWVDPGTNNAKWRVRTIWPLRQQYLISHLELDYSAVIIARETRDYVWILARNPNMSDAQYAGYLQRIAAMGYDMSRFSRYPQNGSTPDGAPTG